MEIQIKFFGCFVVPGKKSVSSVVELIGKNEKIYARFNQTLFDMLMAGF